MIRSRYVALVLMASISSLSNGAFAGPACTNTAVSNLSVADDGTVSVTVTARSGILRMCNVSRALQHLQQVAGGPGRTVTGEACRAWVDTLRSAISRGTQVDIVYAVDDSGSVCTDVPLHSSSGPVYLPTAVTQRN